MTAPAPDRPRVTAGVGRWSTTAIAIALAAMTIVIALLTPEPAGRSEGGLSTYSTAPMGAQIVYELAHRLGWRTERRTTTLDSLAGRDTRRTVQVVIGPSEPLGAHETHALLDHVRRGGGLVFTMDNATESLMDSLGIEPDSIPAYLTPQPDESCNASRRAAGAEFLTLPPEVRHIAWKRHAPGPVEPLVETGPNSRMLAGIGFPLGAGRVAVIGGSQMFSNQAIRTCRLGADVSVMKLIEYTRPAAGPVPTLVFDEFHHGFGVHGGSLHAAAAYLLRTPSGHLLAQALAAGLVLLIAMAPRPIAPRDPEREVRRSPLEHASALGRAYEDVSATRTAASTLVAGLRRRTRGIVAVPPSADDAAYLSAVAQRLPSLAPSVEIVRRAEERATSNRELAAVGEALATIEQQLQSTPSPRS